MCLAGFTFAGPFGFGLAVPVPGGGFEAGAERSGSAGCSGMAIPRVESGGGGANASVSVLLGAEGPAGLDTRRGGGRRDPVQGLADA